MCVIIILAPGASINKDHFFNAVHNNWNGYGVVLKDANNHLQVIKKCDPKGNDPEEIWKIVEDNKDIERYVHVRFSTKGSTDDDNTQPFQVYDSASRKIWFMHNGTLPSFGSYNKEGKSDTNEFCEKILAPALLRWSGEAGKADYTDPQFHPLIIDKQWSGMSRGLFISSDLPYVRIGNSGMSGWQEYKHKDETSSGDVWISNNDYFEKLTRGPLFQTLEDERKAKEAKEREERVNSQRPFQEGYYSKSGTNSGTPNTEIKEWDGNANRSEKVMQALSDILDTWDVEDPQQMAKLRHVAYDEWVATVQDKDEFMIAALLSIFAEHLYKVFTANRMLKHKGNKAELKIEELVKEIKGLKNVRQDLAA